MQTKWKILIVTNNRIIPEYYQNDRMFNGDNWTFFNVSKDNRVTNDNFNVINALDMPNYEFLGKEWAESEVIYNVSKLDLFKDFDYLGIIHWDFNLYNKNYDTYRITENINRILEKYDVISFFQSKLSSTTGYYDVMMDERKPNCLFCRESGLDNPVSCLEYVKRFLPNPNIDISSISPRLIISLCSSFLCKRTNFIELGNMISRIKSDECIRRFDTENRHRFPGQLIERLFALYLSGMFFDPFDFTLDHRFIGGNELKNNDINGENY